MPLTLPGPAATVIPLTARTVLGVNQQTYQQLRLTLGLGLRHQLLLAVCDDLPLQMGLVDQLETELSQAGSGALQRLVLDPQQGDLSRQVVQRLRPWLRQAQSVSPGPMPSLQVLGMEQMTRQPALAQGRFLASLPRLRAVLPHLQATLLIWLPRPWLRSLQQAAPDLWRCCHGLFEFAGEPTPMGSTVPAAAKTVRPSQQKPSASKPFVSFPAQASREQSGGQSGGQPSTANPAPAPEPAPPSGLEPPVVSEHLWQILTEDLAKLDGEQAEPDPLAAAPDVNLVPETPAADPDVDLGPETPAPSPTADSDLAGAEPPEPESSPGLKAAPIPPAPEPEPPQAEAEAEAVLQQAQACRDRIFAGGPTPAGLDEAIQRYERAIAALPTTDRRYLDTLNDLAGFYWLRSQSASSEEAPNLMRRSGLLYESAIASARPDTPADTLARIYSNLGAVWTAMANLDNPDIHLDQAIRAYHQALKYRPATSHPLEYSSLQNSLGSAYWSLSQITSKPHLLHCALTAYQEAQQYRRPHQDPLGYALIQNNLGIACWSLARHERPVFLLQSAIAAYQAALTYRTVTVDPIAYAATQNNLGTAHWELAAQYHNPNQRQHHWQQATAAYHSATQASQPLIQQQPSLKLPFDLWAVYHSLGVVHDHLALVPELDPALMQQHLSQALQAHIQALQGWQSADADAYSIALDAIVQNIRNHYQHLGLAGQQQALAQVPAHWLPVLLPKL
jgi:tetratricopeptide (TPR) repeat protein